MEVYMNTEEKRRICEAKNLSETFTIQLTNPMLYDQLYTLAAEYFVSVELLVNVAVKHLLEDIDFVRDLRTGKNEQKE